MVHIANRKGQDTTHCRRAEIASGHLSNRQPRPANGIFVRHHSHEHHIRSPAGRLAIKTTAFATYAISIRGSGFVLPSACRTPVVIRAVNSVAALPILIWLPAISCGLPSSAMHLVSPVIACFVQVYGTELGRGVCAEIDPLLMTSASLWTLWTSSCGRLPVQQC